MVSVKKVLEEKERFQKIDEKGRIYIPKDIRKQFRDCYFYITVENGKIVLDPVKID